MTFLQNNPLFIFIIFLASLVQGALGFGYMPVAMAYIPTVMPYSKAVAISLAIIFFSTLFVTIKYRSYIRWKILFPILIPTLILHAVATFVSNSISSDKMYIFLGFMLIGISVFFFVFSNRIKIRPTVKSGLVLGSICGVCYGFFGIGGPTAAIFLLPAVDDNREYMGTMQALLCINNALGVLIRLFRGCIEVSDVPVLGIGCAAMIIGTIVGLRLFKKLPSDIFRKVVYACVGINGAWIVISNLFLK